MVPAAAISGAVLELPLTTHSSMTNSILAICVLAIA